MASIQGILKNDSKSKLNRVKAEYKTQMIHYTNLKNSRKQFYTMDQSVVNDLADNIELAGGIKEPVIARKLDIDQYEILGGHKRVAAVRKLVEERGLQDFEFIPVHVVQANDWMAEYLLISLNDYPDKSDYERMMEVMRLQDILPHLDGGTGKMTRMLRKRIAEETGISETRIANYKRIYGHLCPEGIDLFKNGTLGVSAAVELASLGSDRQTELLRQGIRSLTNIRKYKAEGNAYAAAPDQSGTSSVQQDSGIDELPKETLIYLASEKDNKQRRRDEEAEFDSLSVAYTMYDAAVRRKDRASGEMLVKAEIEVEALDMWIKAKEKEE